MQHAGADALSDQTAPAVFPEAHHREAHHLGAAPCHGGAAGKTRQSQRRADGGGGNGQRQRHAHGDGYHNAHEKGLKHRRPLDEAAYGAGRRTDGRCYQTRNADAGQNRHDGRHQNVDFGLLCHQLAAFRRDDGDDVYRQRPARAAHGVGGKAHGDQGKQHQRRAVQRKSDGHGNAGADHGGGKAADGIAHCALTLAHGDDDPCQKPDAELLPQSIEDGSHQQRAEQSLRHGPQRIDPVALEGEYHILASQKLLDFLHRYPFFPKCMHVTYYTGNIFHTQAERERFSLQMPCIMLK